MNGSPAWSLFYLYPHVNLEHGDIRDTGPIVLSMLWPGSGQVENWMNSKFPLLMASLFLRKGSELTKNSKIQKEPTPSHESTSKLKNHCTQVKASSGPGNGQHQPLLQFFPRSEL